MRLSSLRGTCHHDCCAHQLASHLSPIPEVKLDIDYLTLLFTRQSKDHDRHGAFATLLPSGPLATIAHSNRNKTHHDSILLATARCNATAATVINASTTRIEPKLFWVSGRHQRLSFRLSAACQDKLEPAVIRGTVSRCRFTELRTGRPKPRLRGLPTSIR